MWIGIVATSLLAVAWGIRGPYALGWMSRNGNTVQLAAGRILLGHDSGVNFLEFDPGVHWGASRYGLVWWFRWRDNGRQAGNGGAWVLETPIWTLMLVSATFTLVEWRLARASRRRNRVNYCPKCNYDRAGIAKDALCPECGAKPTRV
jgi:hypothetical protein